MRQEMMDTECHETVLEEMRKQGKEWHIIQALADNYIAEEAKQNPPMPVSRCEEVFTDKNDPRVGYCFGK